MGVSTSNKIKSTEKFMVKSLPKALSGINGLDVITSGGFPKSRPTLIVGGIGSGKTFMSMQFIINGIVRFNEPGIFMTFEEKSDELLENVSNLPFDLKSLVAENKLYLEHLHTGLYELHDSGKYNIDGLFVIIEQAIKKTNAKRIVLDSLDTLFAHLDIKLLKSEFKRLFNWLKEKDITTLVTAEQGDFYITRLGLEENVADCVIELSNKITNQIATRRLRILKYRGSAHANNEYPFVINELGMAVFPVINESMQYKVSNNRLSTGIHQLDEMLENKGVFEGSSILISGTAGTGKTSIVASFLLDSCKQNKNCMYCAFEESPTQIIRNLTSIGMDLQQYVDSGLLTFYYGRPSLQNLELHFMTIKEKIETFKPSILILDPVTNLMTEGLNSDIRILLIRFIEFLKSKQITIMFTAAITLGSILRNPNDEGISSMVDTWVMLEDKAVQGKRKRYLYVMKSRGMANSNEIRSFLITSSGINLMPVQLNELNKFEQDEASKSNHNGQHEMGTFLNNGDAEI